MDAFGELMEEGFDVAMLGNGFADVEESLELAARLFDGGSGLGRGRLVICVSHTLENNTAFPKRSTHGNGWRNPGSSLYSQENNWMMMGNGGV